MKHTHRLGYLIGMTVVTAEGVAMGQVQDVRIRTDRSSDRMLLTTLIVGERHTGALLGYDRDRARGPWLVRSIIRWLHRNAFYVDWDDIVEIDWRRQRIQIPDQDYPRVLNGIR